METMTCEVVTNNENEMELKVVERTIDGVKVDVEREQKIKEVSQAVYNLMEKSFGGAEKKELTADEIVKILSEDECKRVQVLDDVLTSETKDKMVKDYLEDVDVDELDSDFVERVAKQYIENNASDVLRDSYRELDSWEQKDFIKDCIDDL